MGKSISFHGPRITTDGILPVQSKIDAILQMRAPADELGVSGNGGSIHEPIATRSSQSPRTIVQIDMEQ